MSKRDIVKYTRELVAAGVLEQPSWMSALLRTPPLPPTRVNKAKPPKISFSEDELMEAYYRKHPEARLEPIDLASFEPPTGRRFALRQLELMEHKGMAKRQAYQQAEREFAVQRLKAGATAGGSRQSMIDQIQGEEEMHLQQALRQYASTHGPEMVRQHAKELWQLQNVHMQDPVQWAQRGQQGLQQKQAQQQAQQQQAAGVVKE